MTQLPLMTDTEVKRAVPTDQEAGFGSLTTFMGPLPLKAMEVQGRIDGLLAEVNLCQTFVNTLNEPLEATYIFPLPDRAAVTCFRMEVAGRVIEGVLKERAAARREYEEAIRAGHRAAITEEERPDTFTLRVGNLMPGEEAKVRLTLIGPLAFCEGEATFRFPLVVAPRYIPGVPLTGVSVGQGTEPDTDAVPDASRITPPVLLPGFPNPVRLSLDVEVHSSGLPLRDLRSSLHAVLTEDAPNGGSRVRVQPGERLNRDFLLRFRLADDAVKTALTLKPDQEGQEGTFLLTVVPPVNQDQTQKPRDIAFILDRSGSMGGWKMVAARRAMARMVDTLTDRDRFTVFAFDDVVETPFGGKPDKSVRPTTDGLIDATNRNRFRAVEFLAKIEARGGTEMAQPLDQAVKEFAGSNPERDRILVLVTDGQVGNEDQILRELGPRIKNLRIFTLGIDQAINEGFLRRLATLGGGCCEVVESEDRLDEVMDRIHRRIATPVLTGLHLEMAGLQLEAETLVPRRLPDLFAGAPLFVMGRYRGSAHGSLVLQARDAAGRVWTDTTSARTSTNSAITAVWARGQVRELEDQYVLRQDILSELERRIVETSLKFNMLCRFTAFVAVDRSEIVNKGGQGRQITQPVEAPQGWAMFERQHLGAVAAGGFAYFARSEPEDADHLVADFAPDDGAYATLRPRGLIERARRSLGRLTKGIRAEEVRDLSEPLDLTAYRRRAQELLEQLRNAPTDDLHTQLEWLGMVTVQLEALIEDLKSVGAPPAEILSLTTLLGEMHNLLNNVAAGERELAVLRSYAETVLETFSAGPLAGGTPPQPPQREQFWKS